MIHVDIAQAMSGLDDDLLDEYLTLRAERNRRLERRRMIRKRCLTAAACLLVVLSVMAKAAFDCRYPYIPLENAVGDVSVRYVPEWMIGHANVSHIPDYSEYELFERADCVFSGTVSKIEHVKIDLGIKTIHHSIVTIEVNQSFQGEELIKVRLLTSPIVNGKTESDTVLHYLKEGTYGIFIGKKMTSKIYSVNRSYVNLSELADVEAFDDYSCFFLYDKTINQYICFDTIDNHADIFFESLTTYDPTSVCEYIQKMTRNN